ncbi:MAG: anaerobic sulfite reductase subunit AsrA [Tissierellia bacterium]|nr:anaerobic sulfite reductase subunit AsrA [Tissierellia bacterium]
MGFIFTREGADKAFRELSKDYLLYGPKCYEGESEFSEQDSIRYGELGGINDLELQRKSQFSFKEIVMPINETLFFYSQQAVHEADAPNSRDTFVFLRSCDLHAVKRLDAIYLDNGLTEDYYYSRLRDRVKFILIGCKESFENCFCVDMGSNQSQNYSASIDWIDGKFHMDVKDAKLYEFLSAYAESEGEIHPQFVTETDKKVIVNESVDPEYIINHDLWTEYNSRCIACGRCNFTCPTCTCYTMEDIAYGENVKAGERRRRWAGCMVDGFTDVAGGEAYRRKYGERMRFKALHKVYDFKKRQGYHMCTGCGRCDDACPEYISFSSTINKINEAMLEVSANDEK